MSLRFITALVLSIVCLVAPAWADFETGMDAYHRGDYATALREWRPLAEQGVPGAQYNIRQMYRFGQGVPQDYVQARQWYEKAAAQGDALGETGLGTFYLNGSGVPQDYQKAAFWLRRAADQGEAMAQGKLGVMYSQGWGVTRDDVEAHKWYNLSAANGDKLGARMRDEITKRMTPAQIAEAQQLAREWKPIQK